MLSNDVLPQPYRFVNKLVQNIVGEALETVTRNAAQGCTVGKRFAPSKLLPRYDRDVTAFTFTTEQQQQQQQQGGEGEAPSPRGIEAIVPTADDEVAAGSSKYALPPNVRACCSFASYPETIVGLSDGSFALFHTYSQMQTFQSGPVLPKPVTLVHTRTANCPTLGEEVYAVSEGDNVLCGIVSTLEDGLPKKKPHDLQSMLSSEAGGNEDGEMVEEFEKHFVVTCQIRYAEELGGRGVKDLQLSPDAAYLAVTTSDDQVLVFALPLSSQPACRQKQQAIIAATRAAISAADGGAGGGAGGAAAAEEIQVEMEPPPPAKLLRRCKFPQHLPYIYTPPAAGAGAAHGATATTAAHAGSGSPSGAKQAHPKPPPPQHSTSDISHHQQHQHHQTGTGESQHQHPCVPQVAFLVSSGRNALTTYFKPPTSAHALPNSIRVVTHTLCVGWAGQNIFSTYPLSDPCPNVAETVETLKAQKQQAADASAAQQHQQSGGGGGAGGAGGKGGKGGGGKGHASGGEGAGATGASIYTSDGSVAGIEYAEPFFAGERHRELPQIISCCATNHPHYTLFAVGMLDGMVQVWDPSFSQMRCLFNCAPHRARQSSVNLMYTQSMAFQGSQYLVVANAVPNAEHRSTVIVYDVETNHKVSELKYLSNLVRVMPFGVDMPVVLFETEGKLFAADLHHLSVMAELIAPPPPPPGDANEGTLPPNSKSAQQNNSQKQPQQQQQAAKEAADRKKKGGARSPDLTTKEQTGTSSRPHTQDGARHSSNATPDMAANEDASAAAAAAAAASKNGRFNSLAEAIELSARARRLDGETFATAEDCMIMTLVTPSSSLPSDNDDEEDVGGSAAAVTAFPHGFTSRFYSASDVTLTAYPAFTQLFGAASCTNSEQLATLLMHVPPEMRTTVDDIRSVPIPTSALDPSVARGQIGGRGGSIAAAASLTSQQQNAPHSGSISGGVGPSSSSATTSGANVRHTLRSHSPTPPTGASFETKVQYIIETRDIGRANRQAKFNARWNALRIQ